MLYVCHYNPFSLFHGSVFDEKSTKDNRYCDAHIASVDLHMLSLNTSILSLCTMQTLFVHGVTSLLNIQVVIMAQCFRWDSVLHMFICFAYWPLSFLEEFP